MAERRLRSFVSRLMLVTGLAAMLVVGTVAVGGPSEASASPNYSCEVAMSLSWGYLANAQVAYNNGMMEVYYYWAGKAEALAEAFYPC